MTSTSPGYGARRDPRTPGNADRPDRTTVPDVSRQPRGRRANRRSGRRRDRANRTARREPRPQEPDLITQVGDALGDGEPLSFLALVSGLLAMIDPRQVNPFGGKPEPALPTREDLVASFLDVALVETSALLAAIATLSGDEVLTRRASRAIADRGHALPTWLAELGSARGLDRAVEMVHVFGDGDDVCIGARLPDGHELTAIVYVDHNMGTMVKDAFVVPEPLPEVAERMIATAAGEPDTAVRDIDPADARARISTAVERGAITWPPSETESWPACRPIVEWMVRLLPEGGRGLVRHEWTAAETDELAARFLASPFAAGLDDPDHRDLLDSLLWFGTGYGPGDPLRWSPVAVEIVLLDWIPRKIVADPGKLAKAPDLLRAFIRFSHHERGIRAALTEETLAAVDGYEPEYLTAIDSPRLQGPEALLAAMGAIDPEARLPGLTPETHEVLLESLRRAVGGADALDRLDDEPLPDDVFDWEPVPADVRERVGEVLTLVDRCCDEMLDGECRTACRRFLSRAAAADPAIFRRRGRADTAAAAVCWVIGKANRVFGWGGPLVKDMTAHFGVSQGSLSGRSVPLLLAVGVDPYMQFGAMDLGSPDYLTGERRSEIIASRDTFREMLARTVPPD